MLSPISTVLVVDDNPMVRATAVRLFEDLGFKVVDAYYGAAALRLIERDPEIGLLFVNVRMPGMSGLENGRGCSHSPPTSQNRVHLRLYRPRDVPADAPFVPKP